MAIAYASTVACTPECFLRPTDLCFYCGNPLIGDIWVYWNGNDEKQQQIWLHRYCAKSLADHLFLDFSR